MLALLYSSMLCFSCLLDACMRIRLNIPGTSIRVQQFSCSLKHTSIRTSVPVTPLLHDCIQTRIHSYIKVCINFMLMIFFVFIIVLMLHPHHSSSCSNDTITLNKPDLRTEGRSIFVQSSFCFFCVFLCFGVLLGDQR